MLSSRPADGFDTPKIAPGRPTRFNPRSVWLVARAEVAASRSLSS